MVIIVLIVIMIIPEILMIVLFGIIIEITLVIIPEIIIIAFGRFIREIILRVRAVMLDTALQPYTDIADLFIVDPDGFIIRSEIIFVRRSP